MFVSVIKMLIYERIDILGIDLDKTGKSKECMICHYWFFEDKNLNFEKIVSGNGCHDTSVMRYELQNIPIFKIKDVDYRCIIWNMIYE